MGAIKHFIEDTVGMREYERHPKMVAHALELAGLAWDEQRGRDQVIVPFIRTFMVEAYLRPLKYTPTQKARIEDLAWEFLNRMVEKHRDHPEY